MIKKLYRLLDELNENLNTIRCDLENISYDDNLYSDDINDIIKIVDDSIDILKDELGIDSSDNGELKVGNR